MSPLTNQRRGPRQEVAEAGLPWSQGLCQQEMQTNRSRGAGGLWELLSAGRNPAQGCHTSKSVTRHNGSTHPTVPEPQGSDFSESDGGTRFCTWRRGGWGKPGLMAATVVGGGWRVAKAFKVSPAPLISPPVNLPSHGLGWPLRGKRCLLQQLFHASLK